MYYVRVKNNVKLAVEDINPRGFKTILFIHGWPLSKNMFEYQTNILLEFGYRIVSIDLRGFGQSDTTFDGYSYDQMAADIYEVVNKLGLNNFILAGFSMGGAIVLRYMSLFRGYRVSKLALLAAAAPSFVQRPGYPYGFTQNDVNSLIQQAYTDRPQMVSDFGDMLFGMPHTKNLMDWFKNIGWSASGIGTIKTAVSLRDEDLRPDLKYVKVPTGIFHGRLDRICPYKFAEILHQGINNSVLYTFENSGHAVFYDELERFNQSFLSFIE